MTSARHARHARPRSGARTALHHSLVAGGAVGVLAVPVTATLMAESPRQASAAPHAKAAPVQTVAQLAAYDDAAKAHKVAAAQAAASQAAQQAAAAVAAAQVAAAAQAAAQAAAAQAAVDQAAQAAASRSRAAVDLPAPSGDPRAIAQAMLTARGQGGQFSCLSSLWSKESGWSTTASNGSSGAYGIPQALPGSKMASAGADWRTNPATQIAWGLSYIESRYGSPCAAWGHSQSNNWY